MRELRGHPAPRRRRGTCQAQSSHAFASHGTVRSSSSKRTILVRFEKDEPTRLEECALARSEAGLWCEDANELETQSKPLGLGSYGLPGGYIISAGIEFGRVVDGNVWCVHLAWPLTLVYVVTLAPYCLPMI